jgi:cystathionine beta-lyase
MSGPRKDAEATRMIRAGAKPRPLAHTVGPPIQRGSTVLMPDAASLYSHDQATYGRAGLGVHEALAEALCELEGAHGVRLFPSGLAAVTGALMAVLKAGDEILVADNAYAPTRRFCDKVLTKLGVKVGYFPPRASAEAILARGGPALRLVLMESPGSLTYEITDAAAVARLARERGVLTMIDNTWAAGLLFKPLAHGVDISVQALTKYVCGHSDVFLGSAAAADPKLTAALDEAVWNFGWAVSPDDVYQGLRGLRTLPTRLARHQENAIAVARWLMGQPEVKDVLCPALPHSPDHALWKRDFTGANGLLSVVFEPVSDAAIDAFLDALTLFGLGFSWGGFESLAISEGNQVAQRRFGDDLGGPLVRLHIGLEDPADLIADLRRGLDALAKA